jgi:hypothetical protein
MLRRNGLWSTVLSLMSAMDSSQATNGSNTAAVLDSSGGAVPAAQSNCSRYRPLPFRQVFSVRFFPIALLLLACGSVWAQTTGTLLGVVSDPNGAVVPSARVRVTNIDTGFTANVVSTSEGSYLLPLLPIGHYSITVEASGFKSFKESGVMVPVAQNIRVDVKLEIGQVSQTVTVSGNAINIDTADPTIGETVDTARLESLPLNGRNALGLMGTLPGVTTANAPTTVEWARNGPSFSISGSRTNAGNLMLDGTTLTDALSGTSQNLPTVDALEEFRVLTDSYSAEYGRAAGSVILAVTKSGSNQFHGSAWEFIRNDAFDAANAFTPAGTRKPLLRQNQFGGDVGGPVFLPKYNGRNRTFFFFAWEGIQVHQQDLTVTYPPDSAVRSGDISSLSGIPNPTTHQPEPIIDPNTGLPFPNNQIPSSELDAFAQNALKLYAPEPNYPDGSLRLAQSAPTTGNQYSVKIDQTLGKSDRLWGRYFWNKDKTSSPQAFPFWQNPLVGRFLSYALNETHTFSPTLINEFQVSYSRPQGVFGPELGGKSAQELGVNANQQAPFPQVPDVSVSGSFSFGTDWDTNEPSYFRQFDDKLSWIKGKHSIRAGYMIMYATNSDLAHPPAPSFSFSGQFSNNPVVDFLIGRPANMTVITAIVDDGTSEQYQPFIEDSYKITNRFTMDLGLRYDLDTPWTEKRGNAATYISGAQSQKYPIAPPGLVVPGDHGVPAGLYRTFKGGVAPRIGLAWDPTGTGQTSVRAGWGIYHAAVNEEVEAAPSDNEPFLVIFGFTPPSTANPYAGTTDPLPYNPAHPSFGPFPGMSLQSIDPNYRYADVQQFNLNIQHRFGNDFFLETAYVGGVSHHLYEVHDINPAVYGPGATEANAQSRRPIFPQYYGSMTHIQSDANANYNSLQIDAQKRFSHGYSVQATYTWGKSIDERSTPLIGGQAAQDPHNYLKGERALSDFNVAQIVGINGLWDLPSLRGNRLESSVLGGWRLSGIVRYNTGMPTTPISGVDAALIGSDTDSGNERPDFNGNPHLSTSRSRSALEAAYFNPAAYTLPSPGQFGNVPRNSLIGPGFLQNDFSIVKTFPFLGDKGKFTFRAEYFNVMNWTNLEIGWLGSGQNSSPTPSPNMTLTSPAFGKITNAGDPRIGQFALRYDF